MAIIAARSREERRDEKRDKTKDETIGERRDERRQERRDVNICESKGYSSLMWAADLGNRECVGEVMRHLELKINYHDGDGNTALIWAADRSLAEVMKVLLESPHIDVNIKGDGYTALITYNCCKKRRGEER